MSAVQARAAGGSRAQALGSRHLLEQMQRPRPSDNGSYKIVLAGARKPGCVLMLY